MRKAFVAVAVSVFVLGWGSGRAMAVCGDGVVDAGEDCDVGGTCIGGAAAGQACHVGDSTCTAPGVCTTFGGHSEVPGGCAANCTAEHDVPYELVPGVLNGLNLVPNTSGVAINSDFISIPLPFGGACSAGDNANLSCATAADCPGGTCVQSQEIFTIGREINGQIPVVVKAASVKYPGIPVTTLACGCIHGISSETCGGTFFDTDGKSLSPNCTPGFLTGTCSTPACTGPGDVCAGKAPCAFVHGAGNTAAGVIGCTGLDNIDLSYTQDSGGSAATNFPPQVVLSGHGGPGSALLFETLGITAALGPCTGSDLSTYGPDGIFCTADDPPGGLISAAGTLPVVTGTAQAQVLNANGQDGVNLPPDAPVSASGAVFDCPALEASIAPTAAGGGLVGAFAFVHLDTVGDVAVTAQLFAGTCVGDPRVGTCGPGSVTPANLDTIMVMALGGPGTCDGSDVDSNGSVDINELVAGVNNGLYSCSTATA